MAYETISQQTQDKREKIQALSLAKECYAMKLELLTNATAIDDAIRFVMANTNNKKAEVRAACDIEAESNQPNIINDHIREQQHPAYNEVSTSTTNQDLPSHTVVGMVSV